MPDLELPSCNEYTLAQYCPECHAAPGQECDVRRGRRRFHAKRANKGDAIRLRDITNTPWPAEAVPGINYGTLNPGRKGRPRKPYPKTGRYDPFDCVACGRKIGNDAWHRALDYPDVSPHRVVCSQCLSAHAGTVPLHRRLYPDCPVEWHDMHDHPGWVGDRPALSQLLDRPRRDSPAG